MSLSVPLWQQPATYRKKAGLSLSVGNPALLKGPVIFRPRVSTGLAFSTAMQPIWLYDRTCKMSISKVSPACRPLRLRLVFKLMSNNRAAKKEFLKKAQGQFLYKSQQVNKERPPCFRKGRPSEGPKRDYVILCQLYAQHFANIWQRITQDICR